MVKGEGDMIEEERDGVVMRWTCDGCSIPRTILHGRTAVDGRMLCATCTNREGIFNPEFRLLGRKADLHGFDIKESGVVDDLSAVTRSSG